MIKHTVYLFFNLRTGVRLKVFRCEGTATVGDCINYLDCKRPNSTILTTSAYGGHYQVNIKHNDRPKEMQQLIESILKEKYNINPEEVFCKGLPDVIIITKSYRLQFVEIKSYYGYDERLNENQREWTQKFRDTFDVVICRMWGETIYTEEDNKRINKMVADELREKAGKSFWEKKERW